MAVFKKKEKESPLKSEKLQQNPLKTVRMVRAKEDANGGPEEADVHPDEAANWKAAGWKIK